MRFIFVIGSLLSFSLALWAEQLPDHPADEQAVEWQTPFTPISASKAADALVLVLITNEDPFRVAERMPRGERPDPNAPAFNGNAKTIPQVWCAGVLGLACRQAIERRADLKDRVTIQSIAAGLPKELTGGKDRNVPARAVLAVCDGNYRLLSLMVGVPDVYGFLTLIEDAEEVTAILELNANHPNEIVDAIAQRSSQRISRFWRNVLKEMVVAMQVEPGGDDEFTQRSFDSRFRLLCEAFDPTYVSEVRGRFGLTESTDHQRLVILEQHPETRQPWCEAVIPMVAGIDFIQSWRIVVESIWGHQPITADQDQPELLEWFDLQTQTEAVVFSLQAPRSMQHLPWPPVVDKGAKRGMGWQEVHSLATKHPFRMVDAQQLAILFDSRDLKAVDLQHPSMARYLFVEPRRKSAYAVRERDPPGKFAGLLKRSKSSLVKK